MEGGQRPGGFGNGAQGAGRPLHRPQRARRGDAPSDEEPCHSLRREQRKTVSGRLLAEARRRGLDVAEVEGGGGVA